MNKEKFRSVRTIFFLHSNFLSIKLVLKKLAICGLPNSSVRPLKKPNLRSVDRYLAPQGLLL